MTTMKNSASMADWENYLSERLYWRESRRKYDGEPWFNRFPESSWHDFVKTCIEGVIYEDAFRDHFVEKMIKPNFTHWRVESQLFDVVAYRTPEDAEKDTPWYLWRAKDESHYANSIRAYLARIGESSLRPPPDFPGAKFLYGFEIKTDSDDVYHFIDQLPRYAWMFDRVVLVIGEKLKLPKRLPSWVDVWQRRSDDYVRVRSGSNTHTFLGVHAFDPAKWYMPHHNSNYMDFDYSGSTSFREFIEFLRRCAISALFKSEVVEPYTKVDRDIYNAVRGSRSRVAVADSQTVLTPLDVPVPVEVPKSKPVTKLDSFLG